MEFWQPSRMPMKFFLVNLRFFHIILIIFSFWLQGDVYRLRVCRTRGYIPRVDNRSPIKRRSFHKFNYTPVTLYAMFLYIIPQSLSVCVSSPWLILVKVSNCISNIHHWVHNIVSLLITVSLFYLSHIIPGPVDI